LEYGDPTVIFLTVKDPLTVCKVCKRLHCINNDLDRPKPWKLSQVSLDYIGKNSLVPSIHGTHPRCFSDKRTPVLTETGWKWISKIKAGEKVLTHKGQFKTVINTIDVRYSEKPIVKLKYKYDNKILKLNVTPDHKFLTQRGWIEAKDLTKKDKFVRLNVPCCVCGDVCGLEQGRESLGFKLNTTCGKKWCRRLLCKKNVLKYHENLTEEERTIRAAHCSAGTTEYRDRTGKKSIFENPEYWTPEKRKETSNAIKARMPKINKALANCRISKNQKMAYVWLGDAFPNEKIVMEHSVLTYSIDIAFPEHKIGVEIDGIFHQGERFLQDKIRDEKLRKEGWTILRFGWGQSQSIKKSNIIPAVSNLLSNHNGLYSFSKIDILDIENGYSAFDGRAYCLTVEDDESFIAKGIVSHNCRCLMLTILPGYGYINGQISYVSEGYDYYTENK
jgi:very-short-patch-repair endonuclease